jgi:hypothetical protein
MSSDRAYLGVGLPEDVATQARALALQSIVGRHCIDRKACSKNLCVSGPSGGLSTESYAPFCAIVACALPGYGV